MSNPGCTDNELEAAVAAFQQTGSKTKAAVVVGISEKALRNRLKRAAERGLISPGVPTLPGYTIKSIASKGADGAWVKQTKEPGEEFETPAGHVVKGVSALVDGEGRTIQQWIKTRAEDDALLASINAAMEAFKADLPRVEPTPPPERTNKLLLNQYVISDLHLGCLAWHEENRDSNYDLKIGERLLLDWFQSAIAISPDAEVGVLAQLGDFMHHDSLESVTPAHRHVLDADSRLQKIIRVAIRVIRQVIRMLLAKHPKVHIVMASANHDPASSAWMRELLYAMYENEPRITVDRSPDVYYCYEWGKTALFYHHGHKRNVKNVDSVFAGKFREVFGRCPYSYGHVGHLHSDEAISSNLMKVERHNTLAPADAYASSGGWLARRDAKVVTYHREYGEVFRSTLSPQMVQGPMAPKGY